MPPPMWPVLQAQPEGGHAETRGYWAALENPTVRRHFCRWMCSLGQESGDALTQRQSHPWKHTTEIEEPLVNGIQVLHFF